MCDVIDVIVVNDTDTVRNMIWHNYRLYTRLICHYDKDYVCACYGMRAGESTRILYH